MEGIRTMDMTVCQTTAVQVFTRLGLLVNVLLIMGILPVHAYGTPDVPVIYGKDAASTTHATDEFDRDEDERGPSSKQIKWMVRTAFLLAGLFIVVLIVACVVTWRKKSRRGTEPLPLDDAAACEEGEKMLGEEEEEEDTMEQQPTDSALELQAPRQADVVDIELQPAEREHKTGLAT